MRKPSDNALIAQIGKYESGEDCCLDFATIPHLLVIGEVGAGKTRCLIRIVHNLNSGYLNDPSQLKPVQFLIFDPKYDLTRFRHNSGLIAPINHNTWHEGTDLNAVYRIMQDRIFGRLPKDKTLFVIVDEINELIPYQEAEVAQSAKTLQAILDGCEAANMRFIAGMQPSGRSGLKRVNVNAFPFRLEGRMLDEKESKLYFNTTENASLERGEMFLKTPYERTKIKLFGWLKLEHRRTEDGKFAVYLDGKWIGITYTRRNDK
jgi:hypothetical protein